MSRLSPYGFLRDCCTPSGATVPFASPQMPLMSFVGSPSQSSLRDASSPKGRALGIAVQFPAEVQSVRLRCDGEDEDTNRSAALSQKAAL